MPELPTAQVAGSAICDNCGDPCSGYKEDSTLIAMVVCGDRRFRWGLDCSCGKRRWPNNMLTVSGERQKGQTAP